MGAMTSRRGRTRSGLAVAACALVLAVPASGAIVESKLTASDGVYGQGYGASVAISGDAVLVGAILDPDPVVARGAVYVYVNSGGVWTQQAKLGASDAAVGDEFGWSVALDGDTAVIGAPRADAGAVDSGAAYVFTRSGGIWDQQAKLVAPEAFAQFGYSVALAGDTALVGAVDDGGADSGSVYVFIRSGGVWSQQTRIAAPVPDSNGQFGSSVALAGDTAIIGDYYWDPFVASNGAAYVFVRSAGVWSRKATLAATAPAPHDFFGFCAAVGGDAAVIGAPLDNGAYSESGAAYVYSGLGSSVVTLVDPQPLVTGIFEEFQATLERSGGSGPFQWDVSGGSLPGGISLDAATGTLSGAPYGLGRFDATVRVTDRWGASDEATLTLYVAFAIDRRGGRRDLLLTSGGTISVPLDLLAGTVLTLKALFPPGGAEAGTLAVRDAQGAALDLSAALRRKGRSLVVRSLLVPATGRYSVEVLRPDGLQGDVALVARVRALARASGEGIVSTEAPLVATLEALPEATVEIQVRAAEGSDAVPTVLSVRDAEGNELLLAADRQETRDAAVLRMRTPVPGGDLTVRFGARDGSAGAIRWSARIREPKGYAFSVP